MSVLFETARSSIAYHIGNIFKEGELDKNTSVEIFDRSENKASRPSMYYNLDVIISVGYRVKSKRGVAFRKWTNSVLKEYIIKGYAVNHNRMNQLNEVIRVMKRVENSLDTKGVDLYPTLEEKAANLLYFITKNHSFSDGNKRIAATMFLYFLNKNEALFRGGEKTIDDHTLVALTIMIAESKPEEKEMMISVIMNCMS